jgi:hypothetical protein
MQCSSTRWTNGSGSEGGIDDTSARPNALAGTLGRRGYFEMICSENSEEVRTRICRGVSSYA